MDTKVSGSHDPGGEILHFADLAFDPAGHVLRDREGRDISLTPAEFLLLGVFLRNPGRAFSRDELMDEVAGDAAESYDRSIDALVARLRRKIERNPRKPELIVTLPRVGYRFTAQPRPEAAPARPSAADAAPQNDDGAGPAAPPMPATPADLTPAPQRAPFGQAVQRPAERRQVTVFSCEFSGLAALAAYVDPEDFTALAQACRTCCADVIERFGGTVAHFTGDGLTAHFGYPQAHEHDAERAVRAALATIDAIAALDIGGSAKIAARVGIATGPVLAGDLDESDSDYSVVGETPTLAAVLRMRAAARTVLVTAGTRRLVGGLFEYRALEPFQIDGASEPTAAFEVVADHSAGSRFLALREAGATSFVGREDEIASLERAWRQAKSRDGRVALIVGEAGIGKSRLCSTFAERVASETGRVISCQCSPHHLDSALHPLIGALKHAAHLGREDAPDEVRAKLSSLLGADRAEDANLLAHLVGAPAGPLAAMSPQRRKQRTVDAIIGYLARLADEAPLLVLFEDAHWIDPTSLELLTLLVDRVQRLPILLLITARPEFVPAWPADAHIAVMTLSRLSRREAASLIRSVTAKPLPEQMVEEILARTDHVPLFIEELTKAIIEGGHLVDAGEHYALTSGRPLNTVPATLQDSLTARLDRLESARQVAQIGAAIGREFSYAVLHTVSELPENELRAALSRLVGSGLVFQRGALPDATYSFKHALVQDAAHGSLPRSARQRCHARIVEALVAHSPELTQTQPELLAQHCAEAGLAERSAVLWCKAGRMSAARSAMTEAATQLQKGLDQLALLPDTPERRLLELDIRSSQGAVLFVARGHAAPETGQAYARARALWEQLGSPSEFVQIPYGESRHHVFVGDFELAQRLDADLLQLSQQRNDAAGLVLGHYSSGRNQMLAGRFDVSRMHLEQVPALFDPVVHRPLVLQVGDDPRMNSQAVLGIVLFCLGYPEQALARSQAAIAVARSLAHPPSLVASLGYGNRLLTLIGGSAALDHQAGELLAVATEHGFRAFRAQGTIDRGWSKVERGDVAEGIALLREGSAAYRATGAQAWVPYHTALLARACGIAGRVDEGLSLLDDALSLAERRGERWLDAELNRHKGQLLMGQGRAAAGEELYRKALAIAREQSAKLWELRAAASLARLWRKQGRGAQARDLIVPVYGWFTEGFDTADLKGAKALLDAL